ncbi:MAG: S41 family peptidase [Bacilli bacterium]|nr:S41 family peptidase [Bacilli bacterium]
MKRKKSPLKDKIRKTIRDAKSDLAVDANSKSSFNILEVIVIIFISILFGIIVGYIITYTRNNSDEDLHEIITAYNDIVDDYYDNVDKEKLSDAAIKGMIDSLEDPHSNYMDSDTTIDFNETVDGSFVGIGVTVKFENEYNTVIAIEKDGPADKAGLEVNDVIISVDGVDVKGVFGDELTKLIRGEVKTKVTLTVKRNGEEKNFTITRETIEIKTVTSEDFEYDGKAVGYISISSFAANTASQFDKEIKRLEKKKIDSLVIDVRSNPGGHLSQVKEILSKFFDKKTVLYQIQSKNSKKKIYSSSNEKRDYPVAILINGTSASASEILASTFQENYEKSIVVGETSYGKGSVQKSRRLNSGTSIKYTTQKWLTSTRKSINKKGVKPDLEINQSKDYYSNPNYNNDNQLQEALKKLVEFK